MKGILEELKVPEGHTMLEYLGFMTPKAFENANLDPEKTHAFTYKKYDVLQHLDQKILILSIIDSIQERVYNIVVKNLSHTVAGKQVKFLYKSVTVKVGVLSVW